MSKSSTIRCHSRSVESMTEDSAVKSGSALTEAVKREDIDPDEFELNSDVSADNASCRAKIVCVSISSRVCQASPSPPIVGLYPQQPRSNLFHQRGGIAWDMELRLALSLRAALWCRTCAPCGNQLLPEWCQEAHPVHWDFSDLLF